jgi:hypothetical protein
MPFSSVPYHRYSAYVAATGKRVELLLVADRNPFVERLLKVMRLNNEARGRVQRSRASVL